jgi:hypothetical protein
MKKIITLIILGLLTGSALAQLEERTHRVERGETLWGIAGIHWQEPFYWPLIFDANRDKIEDPHWIYPGQEFIIPPLPPVPEISDITPSPIIPDVVTPPEIPERIVDIPEVVTPPEGKKAISFIEKKVPVVPKQLLFKSGYLMQEEEIEGGMIMESEPDDIKRLTTFHTIYINWGEEDGVENGNQFAIFRIGDRVTHPNTGDDLGVIVRILGKLEVQEVLEQSSTAKIVESYEEIFPGDRFMPLEDLTIPEDVSPLPTQEELEAILVAFRDPEDIQKTFTIVYIDKGATSGVQFGDVFEIYRGERSLDDPESGRTLDISDLVVGELQILQPKGETSSAYLTTTFGHLDVQVGETLRLVKRIRG